MAGFYQDAHSTRNVEATIAVDRVNLMQGNAADLVRDASLNDRVELTVRGDVSAKIRVMNFDSPGVQVLHLFFFLFSSCLHCRICVVSVNTEKIEITANS